MVSTIFLRLTFLCGVYGMNFESIPELESAQATSFSGLSALITFGLVLVFRRGGVL